PPSAEIASVFLLATTTIRSATARLMAPASPGTSSLLHVNPESELTSISEDVTANHLREVTCSSRIRVSDSPGRAAEVLVEVVLSAVAPLRETQRELPAGSRKMPWSVPASNEGSAVWRSTKMARPSSPALSWFHVWPRSRETKTPPNSLSLSKPAYTTRLSLLSTASAATWRCAKPRLDAAKVAPPSLLKSTPPRSVASRRRAGCRGSIITSFTTTFVPVMRFQVAPASVVFHRPSVVPAYTT